MHRAFGSVLLRLLRGGDVLSDGEHQLLSLLVETLPSHLRGVAEAQFAQYNVVQREADGRALNFYRMSHSSRSPLSVSPLFEPAPAEAPLIRLTVRAGRDGPLHATLTSVSGRVFCAAFSKPVPRSTDEPFTVEAVVQAWKANFPTRSSA